jgi:hypothetical protein
VQSDKAISTALEAVTASNETRKHGEAGKSAAAANGQPAKVVAAGQAAQMPVPVTAGKPNPAGLPGGQTPKK